MWTIFVDENKEGSGDNENLAELVVMDPMRVVFEPAATETADFLEAWQGGRQEVPVTVEFTSTDTTPKGRRSGASTQTTASRSTRSSLRASGWVSF